MPGVVLVPTGSLTNVARLLTEHPGVRPERIVLMGGAIGLGNITPAAEFNIWADPEAAAIVFESGIDITMVGLDVTHEAIVGPERVERFRRMGRSAPSSPSGSTSIRSITARRTDGTARRCTTLLRSPR